MMEKSNGIIGNKIQINKSYKNNIKSVPVLANLLQIPIQNFENTVTHIIHINVIHRIKV